ncbi:hypothetical protein U9M48_029744 [Paspalum notatum var. saurae]|uniref:Uncharacterized protein n=1 Tax=Paspalum notatum var. saurae TaxID=547442 RepID=A0AAQ3U3Y3_PASNO
MPMAAASPEGIHCREAGDSDEEKQERERFDAVARQSSNRELLEKAQGIQTAIANGMCNQLHDHDRKLRVRLDAIHRELDRRQVHCGAAQAPGSDRCVRPRIVRSTCAEPSVTLLEKDISPANRQANAAMQTRLNESPMEINQFRFTINGLEADRKKITELKAEVEHLQSTIDNIEALHAESSKIEAEKTAKLEAEVSRLRSGVQHLRRRLKEERERANEAEAKASRLRDEIYVLEEEKYSYLAPDP